MKPANGLLSTKCVFPILLAGAFVVTGSSCTYRADEVSQQTKFAPPLPSKAAEYRSHLNKKVTVHVSESPGADRLTVQYAVMAVCEATAVPYQWQKSHKLAGNRCKRFTELLELTDVVASKAIQDILSPVGLNFEVNEYGLYLIPSAEAAGRSKTLSPQAWRKNVVEQIGRGFVTLEQPPASLLPRMDLSKDEYLENFDILWEAVDRTYSFFEHKDINWREVKTHYRPKVEAAESAEQFYGFLNQLVRELKDCHSWLCNYKIGLVLPRFAPEVTIRRVDGKAVVVHVGENSDAYDKGLRLGSIIVKVDGLSVREKIEELRPQLRVTSSERNFFDTAYRRLLDGEQGSTVALEFLPPQGGPPAAAELKRVRWTSEHAVDPGFSIEKDKFLWCGIHPSGFGYIRILSFSGRMEIADEFDLALEKLKDTRALIIDIRDNQGGFGTAQPRIVGRFITRRTKVAVSYIKNGPGHKDFTIRETYFVPTGDWQYTRPVALLMNAATGSAADLFACYMVSTGRPITVGTATHGNLTGVGAYVVLPCNLVVRVSNGYVCDASGTIIEGTGNVPQIPADLTLDDTLNGTDSVIEQAVQSLFLSP